MDYFQVFEKLQTAVGRKKILTACDKAEPRQTRKQGLL